MRIEKVQKQDEYKPIQGRGLESIEKCTEKTHQGKVSKVNKMSNYSRHSSYSSPYSLLNIGQRKTDRVIKQEKHFTHLNLDSVTYFFGDSLWN